MPALSKSQRRLFGWAYAYMTGKTKNAPKKIKDIANNISKEDARDFARTSHDGLPEKKASSFSVNFMRGFISRIVDGNRGAR